MLPWETLKQFSFFADHIDLCHNEISWNNDIGQYCTENWPNSCEALYYESSLGGFLPDPVKSQNTQGIAKLILNFPETVTMCNMSKLEFFICNEKNPAL